MSLADAAGDPDRLALVLFTSGTSGEPKGVLHSFNTIYAGNRPIAEAEKIGPGDTMFIPRAGDPVDWGTRSDGSPGSGLEISLRAPTGGDITPEQPGWSPTSTSTVTTARPRSSSRTARRRRWPSCGTI